MKNKNPLYIVFGIGAGIIAYYLFCKKKDDAVAVVDGQADGQVDGEADENSTATKGAILGGGSITPQNPTIVPIVTPLVLSGTPIVQGKPPIRIINPSPTSVKVVPRPVPTTSFVTRTTPIFDKVVPRPVPINSFIPTPAPRPVSVFTTPVPRPVPINSFIPTPAPRPVSVFTTPVPRPVPTTSFVTRPTLTTAPIGVRPMTNIISRFDGFDGSSFEVGDCLNDL